MNVVEFIKLFGKPGLVSFDYKRNYLIYVLVDHDEVVYIGKTSLSNMQNRLRAHRRDKIFDSFLLYFQTEDFEEGVLEYESALINFVKPKYNSADVLNDESVYEKVIKRLLWRGKVANGEIKLDPVHKPWPEAKEMISAANHTEKENKDKIRKLNAWSLWSNS